MIEGAKPTLESLAAREKFLTKHIETRYALALRLRSIEPVTPAGFRANRAMVIADNAESAIEEKLKPRLEAVIFDESAIKSALSYEEELTKAKREFAGLERRIQTLHRRTGTPVDDSLYGTARETLAELEKRPLADALLRRGLELQDREREREEQKAENITEQPQNGQKPAREQDEAKTKGKGVKDKKGGKESKTYNVILPDGREIKTVHIRVAALIESLLIRPLTTSEQITAVYGDNPPPFPVQKAGTNRTDAKETLEQAGLTIINPNPSRSGRETAYVIVDKDFQPPVISINTNGAITFNEEVLEINSNVARDVLKLLAEKAASAISAEDILLTARKSGFAGNKVSEVIGFLRRILNDDEIHPQIIVEYGKTEDNRSYGLNARVFLTEKKPRLNPVEQTTMSKKEAATQDFNRGLITEDEFVNIMRGLDEPSIQIQPETPAPPEHPAAPEPTEAETLQAEIERLTILRDRSMNIRSSGFLTGEKRVKLDETIQRLDEQIRQLNTQLEQPKQPETPEEKQQAEINEILNTMEKAYPEWAHGWNVEDIFSEFGILTPEIIQVVKTWSLIPEWRRRHDRYEIPAGGIEPSKVALIVFLSRHVNEITDPVQTDQIGEAIKQQVALRREQVRQKIAQALDETGTNPVQDSSDEH